MRAKFPIFPSRNQAISISASRTLRVLLRCVFFRGVNQGLKFSLKDGLQCLAWGRIKAYAPSGQYQLNIQLEPKGAGALQLAFEQLKEKLAQEGLFLA